MKKDANRQLSSTEKAAVVLLGLGRDLASQVMPHLNESEVKRISRAFLSVSEVGRETQLAISEEFRRKLKSSDSMVVDGREFAREVIAGAFGETEGAGILEYITGSKKEPMSKLFAEVPEKILLGFVQSEHPQTISFLLTKMNPDQAAGILMAMPEEMHTEVLIRMANLQNVKSDIVDEVREVISSQLRSNDLQDEEIGGPKATADILNFVDRMNEERILTDIEEMYPDLAEQIRNLMFTFEDVKNIDDKAVQAILKEIPRDQLTVALKTASPELQTLLFRNVSQRAAEMIKEDLSVMGPVKLKDVEKAQQGIVDIVRRLEAEGKITLGTGGAEDQVV